MSGMDWVPPPCEAVALLPAGRRWDAVRTSMVVARRAFEMLDVSERCAAIVDPLTAAAYWLVPAGQASVVPQWKRLGRHVALLGPGPGTHYVGVPSALRHAGPGLHWRLPRDWSGRYLVQPQHLGAILASAVRFAHGAVALSSPCPVCEGEASRTEGAPAGDRPGPAELTACCLEANSACDHAARSPASRRRT
ncbi:hypothetical protein [Streptomyces buecherae]|uniref:hypothetical protein n=1 Tax=Streptomyces buecherae TaxID=2763006 RepID=UPI00364BFB7A